MASLKSAITIVGEYPDIDHTLTGCYTLDHAINSKTNYGMPTRTIYEISGHEHVGKSTLAYFLAAALGSEEIELCDMEGFDKEYVISCLDGAGFKGTLRLISPIDEKKKSFRPHEEMMQEAAALMLKHKGVCSAIIDSVGSIMPIMEAEGDFGEAFMGRRAKLVAQVSRKMANILVDRERPGIVVFVNHQQAILGGQGHTTPGGVTLKHLAACRIAVWNKETIKDKDDNPLGYQIQGVVEKLRYGGKGRKFSIVNLSGSGINRDLTAMFDCFVLGKAVRSTSGVRIGDKRIGYITKLFGDALEGKHEKFEPFYEILSELGPVEPAIEVEEDDDSIENTDAEDLSDQGD